ncbi:hypothetical protein ILUMI_08837 [Ignelater luminosus]|uniref:Uncharacterized protein n=1 Tax=Ignelater luminosus TaxID=2038154 RepID=A0A8K0GD14_IGNLU|nr:hypothetical protein ILUMI_08837 [Ignelater luminosus]
MDPWINCETSFTSNVEVPEKSKKDFFSFEDNFKPLVSDTLPDSKEYLAILESKLNKLKSDPNVLEQLSKKREACMQQLLSGVSSCAVEDDTLDTPCKDSAILRTLAPEKQALTQGERVPLVEYNELVNEEVEGDSEPVDEQIKQK